MFVRPPTRAEVLLMVVLFSTLMIGLGMCALALAYVAPPEKQALALEALKYGEASIVCGLVAGIAYFVCVRFLD